MFAQVRMADIIVNDDQSVVITDNYAEQMTEYHVMLSGSGSKTPGRVSLQAAKTEISGQNKMFVAVDNYHGSLFYGSSFFMEKVMVFRFQENRRIVGVEFYLMQSFSEQNYTRPHTVSSGWHLMCTCGFGYRSIHRGR
eukprot:m.1367649 g.1367649  ORF g.1367649 m.1367649 type:complete len:138 (-) comp24953_c0_seq15:2487-2900(-)